MDAPFRGWRFADFRLEVAKRRLVGANGETIPLSARAYDVLVHLVEHRDRVVTKDELLKAVWPRTIVEDNNLNQAISAVRRVLGDTRDTPRFIVTVAGRGYRFVGDVSPLPDDADERPSLSSNAAAAPATALPAPAASAPGGVAAHAQRSRRTFLTGLAAAAVAAAIGGTLWWNHARLSPRGPKSIAILPFKPLLTDGRNPAMELGVTELLTNRLSRLPGIVVLPLSSVMRFSAVESDPIDAGRQLHVDAVVDGHVYIQGDRVRLTARLLAVNGGGSLWANDYTERVGELLVVQDTLAMQLANALTSELSETARSGLVARETTDVEAWQLYANGRYQIDRRDAASLRRAAEFFDAALRRDPRFALASAGLSDAHTLTGVFGIQPPVKAFGDARQAALRALTLEPGLAAAHVALGHVVTQFDRDLPEGRRHYLQALKLEPEFARPMAQMSLNLLQAGDLSGATGYIRRAQALEPASLPYIALSGWVAYFKRAYGEAEAQLARLVAAVPDAALPRQFLAHVLLAKKEGAKVVRLLEGSNALAPSAFSNLARGYAQTNDRDAALREIDRIETLGSQGYGVGFDLALIHMELGDRARALDALDRGMHDHSQMQCYLNIEPALDAVHDEPRFRTLVQRLGLA
ncbi:MAG TPA: winged helix-turn-helix domain-containing protein [Casimicrobiaceae bacterium]|nr:winged helix-turn-helix domain-containing protein [Casimicrobiaceae bacterium]